ncbi:MAG: HEPN domain-containing protein [Chloroflexi bacterium]|nr:HEPN domain-containing protein [Chloroflexota bacterium]
MGQRLWRQAERDIETAHDNLKPRSYYAAANYAHQAAEKSLKAAYWHLRAEEPPWNHNLTKIAERVAEVAGGLPDAVAHAVTRLEPLFEQTRYPSGDVQEPIPAELVGEREARSAIKKAEEVLIWVRELLQLPPQRARSRKS